MGKHGNIWEGSGAGLIDEKTPLRSYNDLVRFSFGCCDVGTNYCIKSLQKKELSKFYKRLDYFEQMTFQQINDIRSDKGFILEGRGSPNDNDLRKKHGSFEKFLHFRVNGTGVVIRIFAGIQNSLVCILEIDRTGKRNQSAH